MIRSPRFLQDAVIGMAIMVVILALWRLHSRPTEFGGLGPWAKTNIFGAATLNMLPGGAGEGGGTGQPSPPAIPIASAPVQEGLPGTNPPSLASHPSSNNPPSSGVASTNLLNTNGPVTVIAMAPSDLVPTPPGVAAAANVPEAAALARRLGEVSAKGGDIQISLSWRNFNDLDLHCIDPAGAEICFSNRKSRSTGGELDIDQNAHEPFNTSPVENIYWPSGEAPPGLYRIFVVHYAPHGGDDPTAFLVRTVVQGKTNYFRSNISFTGSRQGKLICNLRYDPSNPNPAQRYSFVP
jgi:hypothetical protein